MAAPTADGDVEPARLGCVPGRTLRNAAALPALVGTQLLAQGFIRRRSRSRWSAHQLVFWGCILAGLVTVPLTLGLLHFQSVGQDAERYRVYFSQVGTVSFDAESIIGWLIFHALDIAAVLVLAGVFIFLRRRLRDPGALAVERSGDFLALAGLFAVSVTGLFLTVSSTWLEGRYYSALNTMHALDRDPRLDVHPVREAVPHLPAAGQPRRRSTTSGRERAASRRPVAAAVSRSPPPQQVTDLKDVLGAARLRLRHRRRRQLPGHVSRLPSPPGRAGPVRASRRVRLMARPPLSDEELIATLRPAPQRGAPGGWDAGIEPDRTVKTHCCFCGQQCGIQLKVKDNEVVGFEPWYEFPFNEGKLCPKGVKRYLQGSHPDRLLHPLERDPCLARRVPAR